MRHEYFKYFNTSACLALLCSDAGPLAFSFGVTGLAFCSVCRTCPWKRLWEGGSLWFMRTWPGMVCLWKNSALLLSESSRRKWWIWGIGRTGQLLALWSLLALHSHAVEVPSLHSSCRGHAGWLSAWSLVKRGSLLSSESYTVLSGVSALDTARKEEENSMNLNLHACQPLTQSLTIGIYDCWSCVDHKKAL